MKGELHTIPPYIKLKINGGTNVKVAAKGNIKLFYTSYDYEITLSTDSITQVLSELLTPHLVSAGISIGDVIKKLTYELRTKELGNKYKELFFMTYSTNILGIKISARLATDTEIRCNIKEI